MQFFAAPHLQHPRHAADLIRCMLSWLIPQSITEHLASQSSAAQEPAHQLEPLPIHNRCAQPSRQPKHSSNAKTSTEHLSSNHDIDTLVFDEKLPVPCKRSTSLRIFREQDRNVSPHCAGRMVISGRMQDVWAEIDRLAEVKG